MVQIERDMDVVYLLKTIHKLKAGVATLLADRDDLILKAKKKYQNECTIELDDEGNILSNTDKFVGTDLFGEIEPPRNTVYKNEQRKS